MLFFAWKASDWTYPGTVTPYQGHDKLLNTVVKSKVHDVKAFFLDDLPAAANSNDKKEAREVINTEHKEGTYGGVGDAIGDTKGSPKFNHGKAHSHPAKETAQALGDSPEDSATATASGGDVVMGGGTVENADATAEAFACFGVLASLPCFVCVFGLLV